MKTIGIIGHGRFGKLLAEICPRIFHDSKVKIYSRSQKDFSSLEEVCQCDIVIPAVPIRNFEETIVSTSSILRSGSIVMDVCSVKSFSKEIMVKHLPMEIDILATHPMFGPGTLTKTNNSLKDLTIVIDPVRINVTKYHEILSSLQQAGLQSIIMDADEHDQYAAQFHFTAQYIATLLKEIDIKKTPIDTKSVTFLHTFIEMVQTDSISLLKDMYMYNKYCKKQLEKMNSKIEYINQFIQTA